jgi:hypothetical protein
MHIAKHIELIADRTAIGLISHDSPPQLEIASPYLHPFGVENGPLIQHPDNVTVGQRGVEGMPELHATCALCDLEG